MSAFNSLRHRKEQPLMAPDRLELLSLYGNMLSADPAKRFDYADFDRKPSEPPEPAYLKPEQIVPIILPTHVTPGAKLDLHGRIPDAPQDAFSPPEDFLINHSENGSIVEAPLEPNLSIEEKTEEIAPESRLTLSGITKAIPFARQKINSAWEARHKIAAIFEKDDPAETDKKPSFLAATIQSAKERFDNEETRKNLKKAAVGAGGLAVAAAAGFLVYKFGLPSFGNSSSTAETASNIAPKNSSAQLPDTIETIKSAVKLHVQHKTFRARQAVSVPLRPGSGYSQVFKEFIHKATPDQLKAAYQHMIDTYGPGVIKGTGHYKMANGSFGLENNATHKVFMQADKVRDLKEFIKTYKG